MNDQRKTKAQLIQELNELRHRLESPEGSGAAERKQAEQALHASEHRFKTIFSEAPLGIALIDSITGRSINVN